MARGTHHDAGGRARNTGASGGADAPRGGKWLLGRVKGGRVGMSVRARAGSGQGSPPGGGPGGGRAAGAGQGRASLGLWGPGVRRRGQPPGGTVDSRPDPRRGSLAPPAARAAHRPDVGAAPAHLLQPFHAAGSRRVGSLAEPRARGETTGRQAVPDSGALRARGHESRKCVPPACGVLIPQ